MNRAQRRLDGGRRGVAATDPLTRIGQLIREEFGDAEGERLLRLSLARIPEPGAREGAYAAALRAVLREEQPEWANTNLEPEGAYGAD